jgi:hypothetical protein
LDYWIIGVAQRSMLALSDSPMVLSDGTEFRCCPEPDWFWRPVCTGWCPPCSKFKMQPV